MYIATNKGKLHLDWSQENIELLAMPVGYSKHP